MKSLSSKYAFDVVTILFTVVILFTAVDALRPPINWLLLVWYITILGSMVLLLLERHTQGKLKQWAGIVSWINTVTMLIVTIVIVLKR